MAKTFEEEKAEFEKDFRELRLRLEKEHGKPIDRQRLLTAVVMKSFDGVTLADVI